MTPKIFVIGFNRCGTTSINFLLTRSGLDVLQHRDKATGANLSRLLLANHATARPLLTGIEDFDAYMDMNLATRAVAFEGVTLFRQMDAEHPLAYFILNTRPVDNWIASRMSHLGGKFAENYAAVLDCEKAELPAIWRHQWQAHHQHVRQHFATRRGRFLEYDIESDEPALLRDFLAPDFKIDVKHWAKRNATGGDDAPAAAGGRAALKKLTSTLTGTARLTGRRQQKWLS